MTIWIDAQLSPAIAAWIAHTYGIPALAVRDIGLRQAKDKIIFDAARAANVVVMTKDSDFVELLERHGPPPKVLWVTCGNTSNLKLQEILSHTLSDALELLERGESLVEITDPTIAKT